MYVCIYVCMYVCIYVCMYVRNYICMYWYICNVLIMNVCTPNYVPTHMIVSNFSCIHVNGF